VYRERYLFHGPRFQAISALDLLGDNGLTATLRVGSNDNLFASRTAPQLLTDPCVLDGAGQLVGCWTMVRGRSVLPAGIEKIEFCQPTPPPGTKVPVRLEITSCHPDEPTVYADMEIQDGKGGVWMRIRGWTDFFIACSPKILNLQRFPQRHGIATMHPLPGLPAEAVCTMVSEADLREGDADCLAILYLTVDELDVMKTMTGRRKTEYLLGRMAIKDAIRFWLARQGGAMLYPAAMSIATDTRGKPFVTFAAGERALPEFSVSHSEGLAMALAAPAAVGIDIEPLSRQTQQILADFALPEEIRLLEAAAKEQPDEAWPTRLWCAKEAVGKAVGSGLGGQPRDFELLRVEREGRLRIRHRPTGREVAATTVRDAAIIVAYTVLI
jgi:phosphopantetheinyl transferase